MLIKTLAAGAALSMLVVGGSALAQTSARTSATTGPKEPIPYSQLNAYLKASPKARASKDWWSADASAATGASTDTSATAPMTTDTSATAPMTSGTMSGDAKASTSTDTSVNPPNAMPTTPPTLPDSATSPNPGSNLPASAPPLDPTAPK
jgi:hypothetical protein